MTGLRERILKAATVDEIHTILAEGERYEYASKRTRNAWSNTATRRARELTKENVEIKVADRVEAKPERKPAKHKKRQPNK